MVDYRKVVRQPPPPLSRAVVAFVTTLFNAVLCLYGGTVRRGEVVGNKYGAGRGTIWLDDVQCEGSETSLGSCQHNGWGGHQHCRHAEDVSIACHGMSSINHHSFLISHH